MNYHKILYIVFCVSLTIFIRLEKWNSFSQNEATKYRCRTPHCYSLWREIFFYYSGKIQYLGLKKRVLARKYAMWIIFEIFNPLWILKYCLINVRFWSFIWSILDFEILFDPLWILKYRLIRSKNYFYTITCQDPKLVHFWSRRVIFDRITKNSEVDQNRELDLEN